jgi:hypothetical protein
MKKIKIPYRFDKKEITADPGTPLAIVLLAYEKLAKKCSELEAENLGLIAEIEELNERYEEDIEEMQGEYCELKQDYEIARGR